MQIKDQIKSEILLKKRIIRLDKFIEKALFEKNSYYSNVNPIGSGNDFITSPEISQIFGEIIGSYILHFWTTKINSKFNLIELGPGQGTLFKDIYNSSKREPIFLKNAKITFVEKNKELIKVQKKLVDQFGTPEEKKEIDAINKRHKQTGYIKGPDYQRRYQITNKYFSKLK